jgi:mRNA interferase HicA
LKREKLRIQTVAGQTGCDLRDQKGSHLKLYFNGKQSVLPMHDKELGKGLVGAIKKQLRLKEKE